MTRRKWKAMVGVTVTAGALAAYAAGNLERGSKVFQACMACHSVQPGEHMTGPSLAGILNRKAGTVTGFPRYSASLLGSGLVWNEANLDRWLADPAKTVAGNTMTFAGLRDARDRQDVMAYLGAVSEGKTKPPAAQRRPVLKNASIRARVASIGHCGETYSVSNAAGEMLKFWEPNLRFRTDSSATGPVPGRPVLLPTGMQGDRASVVFAAPGEISGFIKISCP